ncbi:unnamed protein product [Amoebophrya sp. A120]|nr:unnamed protein product [Amoebophrya sp. A120]|eukprot:GSA120T00013798001.1
MTPSTSSALAVLAALIAPLLITTGLIVWDMKWKGHAVALNLYKCAVACVFFFLTATFLGFARLSAWSSSSTGGEGKNTNTSSLAELLDQEEESTFYGSADYTLTQVFVLIVSGTIGITIGDVFWLSAVQLIGAKKVVLVDSLKPFLAIYFGSVWLNEDIESIAKFLIGLCCTSVGIIVITKDTEDGDNTKEDHRSCSAPAVREQEKDEDEIEKPVDHGAAPAAPDETTPAPTAEQAFDPRARREQHLVLADNEDCDASAVLNITALDARTTEEATKTDLLEAEQLQERPRFTTSTAPSSDHGGGALVDEESEILRQMIEDSDARNPSQLKIVLSTSTCAQQTLTCSSATDTEPAGAPGAALPPSSTSTCPCCDGAVLSPSDVKITSTTGGAATAASGYENEPDADAFVVVAERKNTHCRLPKRTSRCNKHKHEDSMEERESNLQKVNRLVKNDRQVQGFIAAALNVIFDVGAAVMAKKYCRHWSALDVNWIRFGTTAVSIGVCTVVARKLVAVYDVKRREHDPTGRGDGDGESAPQAAPLDENPPTVCVSGTTAPKAYQWYEMPQEISLAHLRCRSKCGSRKRANKDEQDKDSIAALETPPRENLDFLEQRRQKSACLWITAAVFFVTFLGPTLATIALFELPVALVIALTSIGPLYALPMLYLLNYPEKKPTMIGVTGAVLTVTGVAILTLI